MDFKLLVAGLAMGLAIAAPLGPVNIIVIREALARGAIAGIMAGIGSVIADSAFAAVAAFGLRSVAAFFEGHAVALDLIGGALLVAIGISAARARVSLHDVERASDPSGEWQKPLATFATTITNPGALLGVFAVFGGMENVLRLQESVARPFAAVAAFAAGGLLWWVGLSLLVSRLKHRLSEKMLNRINRWTGVMIAAFGFALLMEAFG